jgi:SAM-dependent methyltransferase
MQLNFADVYERALVPHLFEPFARDLVARASPAPDERVLDVGCGTGIVARTARARTGGSARIVGLDLSAPMIAVARTAAPDIEWHEGNAQELPFEPASFDLVVSQAALMFFPDRALAVRAMRRVLAPGGRVAASVWQTLPQDGLMSALAAIVERHLGPLPPDRRHAFGDPAALGALFVEAGFGGVEVTPIEKTLRFPDPLELVRLNTFAVAPPSFPTLEDDERQRLLGAIVAEAAELIARHSEGGELLVPMGANVVTARA